MTGVQHCQTCGFNFVGAEGALCPRCRRVSVPAVLRQPAEPVAASPAPPIPTLQEAVERAVEQFEAEHPTPAP